MIWISRFNPFGCQIGFQKMQLFGFEILLWSEHLQANNCVLWKNARVSFKQMIIDFHIIQVGI